MAIVSQCRLFRDSLSAVIESELHTVVYASDVVPQQPEPAIELAIVSWNDSDVSLIHALEKALPTARVLAINVDPRHMDFSLCLRLNMAGFLTIDADQTELFRAIELVDQGQTFIPPGVAAAMLKQLSSETRNGPKVANGRLTIRERQIAECIVRGLSNKQIAEKLNIATHTVKSHVHNILEKLQLRNRANLVSCWYDPQEGSSSIYTISMTK